MRKIKQIALYTTVFVVVFSVVFGGLMGLDGLFGLREMFGREQEWPTVCDENNVCVWITTTPLPTPGPATVEAIATFYARVWATDAAATAAVVDVVQPVVTEDGQ